MSSNVDSDASVTHAKFPGLTTVYLYGYRDEGKNKAGINASCIIISTMMPVIV